MILTDQDKHYIERFIANPAQVEAVKKVLLAEFTKLAEKTLADILNLNNQDIGERVRAAFEGKECLEKGFIKLEQFKKVEEPKQKINQGF